MTAHDTSTRRLIIAGAFLVGIARAAAAQDPSPAAPSSEPAAGQVAQGPLVVERIPSGWVVSPEVTITRFDKQVGTLAGVYGGWLTERTWLVGAGGYWLANRSSDFKLAYAGLVMQYMARGDRRVGFGVKGLVGGGEATFGARFKDVYGTPVEPEPAIRFGSDRRWGGGHHPLPPVLTPDTRLVFDELIFLAEPQAQLFWNLTSTVRLSLGAGYRFTSGGREVNDRISGPVGSIGVEFGGGR